MTTCVAEAKACRAWEATLDMAQHSQGWDGMGWMQHSGLEALHQRCKNQVSRMRVINEPG